MLLQLSIFGEYLNPSGFTKQSAEQKDAVSGFLPFPLSAQSSLFLNRYFEKID